VSEDVAEKWIAHAKAGRRASEELFEAWEIVHETVADDAEAGWDLVVKLVEAAPDDKILAAVAAGPLEDLIGNWSVTVIDRVETQARRDPKFRRCLTGVWLPSQVRPEFADRIKKYTSTVVDPL
jgi:hypothetical protein